MDKVWILNVRNDYYCENNIYVYANEDDAMKELQMAVEDYKNEREFTYEEGDYEATWEHGGYFCRVAVWEEKVR